MTAKQQTEATAQTTQKDQSRQSREESQTRQQGSQQGQLQQREGQGKGGHSPDNHLARRDLSSAFMSPFALLQRFFTDDVESLLTDFGGHRSRMASQRGGMTTHPQAAGGNMVAWVPKVDIVQRGNELVIRADLPGMTPDDVTVDISDEAITISGQRQEEYTAEDNGVYRYERTYGAFFREIPLPEGAIVDQAKATFKDGVLEIRVPAPPEQVSRGRRIEISRGEQANANTGDATKGQ
jgi:HSP20 family protein